MGWITYYRLFEKYDGNITKSTEEEVKFAARDNPNDPETACRIAEEKWINRNKLPEGVLDDPEDKAYEVERDHEEQNINN